jgi:excinuclease ABC subunit C
MSNSGKIFLHAILPDVPDLPGVYRFLDSSGLILYIGKAKNLKNRLSQYAQELTGKNKIMLQLACNVEYSITDSEAAALLLEGQLIKKFKPRFNILLKDDKSFPYIKLRTDHDYPQLVKFRGKNLSDGKFFGPFASAAVVDTTLLEIQKIFKLRSCSDSYFAARTRPCLQYQIKRCSGPCAGKVTQQEYAELVTEAKAFLSGKNHLLQQSLLEKMTKFSDELNFEKAAEIRDKLKAINYVQMKAQSSHVLGNADVIALADKHGEFCVQVFLYRESQPCGNQAYFPENTSIDSSAQDVLSNFLLQFYQNKPPGQELILSHDLPDKDLYVELFKEIHNLDVKIITSYNKAVGELVENATHNAQLALERHLKTAVKNNAMLQEIQYLFGLPDMPRRIEIYDNSHIQGAFPVGAMVVAGANGFEKKEYRLFNFTELNAEYSGDDYAMLAHVMRRRLRRVKSEPHLTPDLMIIDGGIGHMGVVQKVMQESQVSVPFVCMSKGVERNSGREYFHQIHKDSFTLDKNLPVMKYLQILRDEVHKFAITAHRKKRSAAIYVSSLDEIAGIGESRKKALLSHFGSFAAVRDASVKELAKVHGISPKLAKQIYEQLHP